MHKFSPHKAERLESEERHAQIKPEALLQAQGLAKGMTMIDVGAGTGFFARAASRIVSSSGRVIALDMSDEMIEYFKSKGVPDNVQLLRSEEYLFPVEDSIADFTLMAFVAHENEDVARFFHEVIRATKPMGIVLIVDWIKQDEEHGPPKDDRMSPEELLSKLSGFKKIRQGLVSESHYYLVLQNNKMELVQ